MPDGQFPDAEAHHMHGGRRCERGVRAAHGDMAETKGDFFYEPAGMCHATHYSEPT
jgi:hypothetical protein